MTSSVAFEDRSPTPARSLKLGIRSFGPRIQPAAPPARKRRWTWIACGAIAVFSALALGAGYAVFAHGQNNHSLDLDDSRAVMGDSSRPTHVRNAALVRSFGIVKGTIFDIEALAREEGELGANARALLEKLKR